ncbi:hypothetical protein [Variovorax sp. PAMC26660]|uniref:hypothetical protein n=1 Tax=Variovorax sp. PAMC26660 TaxID=2762322 RepID=UPI00164CF8C3|nr:hypothetical protein [Variovorax sp. PAMC26660]QNK69184.1 hypothetical protein H7F35_05580 [Variovorax sp. PAMC26660]
MSLNLFLRLLELQAEDPQLVGQVSSVFADGTAIVTLPGGGQMRVRNPLASAIGAHVYLKGGAITASAPAIDVIEVFVG